MFLKSPTALGIQTNRFALMTAESRGQFIQFMYELLEQAINCKTYDFIYKISLWKCDEVQPRETSCVIQTGPDLSCLLAPVASLCSTQTQQELSPQ